MRFPVVSDHPVLVDPDTGYVDMITVMKYYPYMTKEFVSTGHTKVFVVSDG